MFPAFDHVPAYPLVFVVFWGAAAVFALAMARHLRVFAAANPVQPQPRPLGDIPRRFFGLVEYALVQTKMFKDPRAGLMHAGIFWGFVFLTIGTANIVTGGLVQAIVSIPFDGALWVVVSAFQNVSAVIVKIAVAARPVISLTSTVVLIARPPSCKSGLRNCCCARKIATQI